MGLGAAPLSLFFSISFCFVYYLAKEYRPIFLNNSLLERCDVVVFDEFFFSGDSFERVKATDTHTQGRANTNRQGKGDGMEN